MELAIAGMALSAIGTLGAANAQREAGEAQQAADESLAAQYTQQAGQERASSQRRAIEERRKADLVASRVRAVSAASGAGASDPTIINIENDIAGKGEYNALTALYGGEERARGMEFAAETKRFEGGLARRTGNQLAEATLFKGFGSILGSAGSMGAKYG